MKNFRYIKSIFCAALFAVVLTGCEEDPSSPISNFVGFEIGGSPRAVAVTKDATQTFEIKVYATETRSSDRTVGIMVDTDASSLAVPFSVPSQVTIPGGSNEGVMSFSITDNDDLGFVAQTLAINFIDEAGMDFGDGLVLSVTEECLDTIATLNLTLDNWPNETSWELFDLSGTPTVIFSGGPYVNPDDDFVELSFDFCLASGDYGIAVYDSYGDGGPTFSITSGGADLVADTTVAGSQSSATFTID